MYLAITTTYRGPTNTKPARIIAKCGDKRMTLSFEYEERDQHTAAAMKIASKYGWTGDWFKGDLGKSSYVFVRRTDKEPEFQIFPDHTIRK